MQKQDLQKVAELSRLKLTEVELEKFSEQISDIVKYVEQLNEVDTQDIEPTSQVTGLMNVLRPDEQVEGSSDPDRKALLSNAPEQESNYVKVPGVFAGGDE
ncbi:Asp-tRNA(Asn)/Glu-tRNA(Gln) amidotransferase subunit GatC [Candidatus Berkelbacteria bacterium]|nr:Asp-tRNA(Asn)/Glu-tRNA(Gln) amidotransferase subunit GatC [Candidatus Berkelbacteria bacterium]